MLKIVKNRPLICLENKMKVGLVLEGGAMRGMFSAGVLDVMMDHQIHYDGIIGVSAGALFGVNYLSKQRGRALRYNLRFLNDKRYMGWRCWFKTGDIVSKEFAYYEVPFKHDVFDNDTFKRSSTDFFATVTNLVTGQAEYIKINDVFAQMEVLRASASMPLVSNIVEIGQQKYLDGAIADSIPVKQAQQMGFDKIIVVLTRPLNYRKAKSSPLLPNLVYRHYPPFARAVNQRYAKYNAQVEDIIRLEQAGKIFVIRPSCDLAIQRIEKDPVKVQAMYDLGVQDMQREMERLKAYLQQN